VAGSTAGGAEGIGYTDGTSAAARFNTPYDLALGAEGSFLYVADSFNHAIRVIDLSDGSVATVAGTAGDRGYTDGTSAAAQFYYPRGIAMGAEGSFLYVSDTFNHAIRAIKLSDSSVATVAGSTAGNVGYGYTDGTSAAAQFNYPGGLALKADGSVLYVADYFNNAIRVVDLSEGSVATVAGSTARESGYVDGTSAAARFYSPYGLDVWGTSLYVADTFNHAIRVIEFC
jgi:sugar lactone lactonase YvrE